MDDMDNGCSCGLDFELRRVFAPGKQAHPSQTGVTGEVPAAVEESEAGCLNVDSGRQSFGVSLLKSETRINKSCSFAPFAGEIFVFF